MAEFKLSPIPSVSDICNNLGEMKEYVSELTGRLKSAEEKILHHIIYRHYMPVALNVYLSLPVFVNNCIIERDGNYIKYYDNNTFLEIRLKDPNGKLTCENTEPVIIHYAPLKYMVYYPRSKPETC